MKNLKDIRTEHINETIVDDDKKEAAKLNRDLTNVISSIDKAMTSIDQKLSSFGSPGLKSAFTQAIKTGLIKTGSFDASRASKVLKGYYKRA